MVDLLADAVARHPERTALEDGRRSWTYGELERVVRDTADRLSARGAGPGRAVGVVLPPRSEAVVAVHAVLRTGALLAPLDPALTPGELADALAALDPVLVLCDRRGDVGEGVGAALGTWTVLAGDEWLPDGGAPGTAGSGRAGGPEMGAVPGARERPVAALWTSGTSGSPRGVLLGEGAFRHSARASRARLGLGDGDRWHASLSVAHVGGLALVTRAALLGSALVATGPFRVDALSRHVDEGRVTHASLVPTMLRRLLDHREDRPPPPSLRCLLVGGAACPPPLVERALAAGMPVALTYGCTEASSQVATAPPELVRRKPDTVGPPLEGVEVRIDGSGEILVRGPTLARGLVGGGPVTGDDGWLRTGDLGALDGEGHLRVTGRRSDRIVTGGVNVDPAEVEAVLLDHPGVAEAAVVGLADPEWGERVTAAVVPASAGADGGPPDPAVLRTWLRERLAGAKVPKEVVFLDALPSNPNGKVDRAALRTVLGRGEGSAR